MEQALQERFMLNGRVMVITGAGGGICSAIAKAFADAGGRVACLDRSVPTDLVANIKAAGGDAVGLACDVTDEAAVNAAIAAVVAEWGGIYGLVNGASNDDPTATVVDLDFQEWQRTFA